MELHNIQRHFHGCPDLAGVDAVCAANLFTRAQAQTFGNGQSIYREGAGLDGSFGLLLSGELELEQGGNKVGTIGEAQVFGEMAYFLPRRARNATLRVASPQAQVLRFNVSPADLGSRAFSSLRRCLAALTAKRAKSPLPILIA